MGKTKAGRRDSLSVNIYRKKDNRAGLVFRYKDMLYRITTVLGHTKLVSEFRACADPGSRIVQLQSPKSRKWAVEIVSGDGDSGRAAVVVWELMQDGKSLMRFAWLGAAEDINAVFKPFQ
jgi:hypothetical protein